MYPPLPVNVPVRRVYDLFGAPTAINESNPVATTTLREIVNHNPNRVSLVLTNLGASPVYVQWSNALPIANGLPLNPNGGQLILRAQLDGELLELPVFAAVAAGSVTLYLLEVVLLR